MTKKTTKGKIVTEIAAGLAAAGAVAAAGYYFYGSTHAKKHRGVAVKWAADMKKEVMHEVKLLQKVSPKEFAKIVDTVASTYRGVRSINAADLKRAATELKSNWDMVERETQKTARTSVSRVKAVRKRALVANKKVVKKIVKKAVAKKGK